MQAACAILQASLVGSALQAIWIESAQAFACASAICASELTAVWQSLCAFWQSALTVRPLVELVGEPGVMEPSQPVAPQPGAKIGWR